MKESTNGNTSVLQSRKQRWKRWATRKWLFPAIYMTAAVAVLSVMWFYDSQNQTQPVNHNPMTVQPDAPVWDSAQGDTGPVGVTAESTGDVAVSSAAEVFQWPMIDRGSVEVVMPFYDAKSAEPAMVTYQDTVRPHVGVDFASPDQKPFDVLASKSGTVKHVVNDPLAGGVIEISHDNGMSTVYQSVTDVKVTSGQTVKQGDLIAKAGRSELEKKQGVHVHFEVRKNGEALDPSKELKSE